MKIVAISRINHDNVDYLYGQQLQVSDAQAKILIEGKSAVTQAAWAEMHAPVAPVDVDSSAADAAAKAAAEEAAKAGKTAK